MLESSEPNVHVITYKQDPFESYFEVELSPKRRLFDKSDYSSTTYPMRLAPFSLVRYEQYLKLTGRRTVLISCISTLLTSIQKLKRMAERLPDILYFDTEHDLRQLWLLV